MPMLWSVIMNKPVNEKEMTPAQKKKKEEIVIAMKKDKEKMKKQYGDKWEEVMYATATKKAMKEAAAAKPDFLDVDKDGDKKEPMKKALKDKKKVTEGVLDSTDDDGWMAKSQLYKLAKYAAELHRLINDSDDLEPWVQAKITAASEDISAVKHYMEYIQNGGGDIDGIAGGMDTLPQANEPLPAATTPPVRASSLPMVSRIVPEKREPTIDDIIRPVRESKTKSLKNKKDNPCWDGYEPVGTKKVRGKTVPNCVPKK